MCVKETMTPVLSKSEGPASEHQDATMATVLEKGHLPAMQCEWRNHGGDHREKTCQRR